jgi:hypothetical protein
MAQVVGDLDPSDEGMHAIEADTQFNESMLITSFDRENDQGVLLRIGNRPNEGYAEVTFCLFPPRGGALFQFARSPIRDNERFDAGGLSFRIIAPSDALEITYAGEVAVFEDPKALANPGPAFKEARRSEVELRLVADAISPMYGARSGTSVGGHYEQHMRLSGTLTIDGRKEPMTGVGNRDHSWGPRNWHRTYSDRTIWCTFDADLAFAVSLTWSGPDTEPEIMGTIVRNGQARPIVEATLSSQFDDDGLYHRSLQCSLRDDAGEELTVEGRVVRFIPFRHRRDGHVTHIGQGMTEFTSGKKSTYGLSEYMDLVQ